MMGARRTWEERDGEEWERKEKMERKRQEGGEDERVEKMAGRRRLEEGENHSEDRE